MSATLNFECRAPRVLNSSLITLRSSFKLLQRYNIRGPKTIPLKGIEKR